MKELEKNELMAVDDGYFWLPFVAGAIAGGII